MNLSKKMRVTHVRCLASDLPFLTAMKTYRLSEPCEVDFRDREDGAFVCFMADILNDRGACHPIILPSDDFQPLSLLWTEA
jgi:hypothetical protein